MVEALLARYDAGDYEPGIASIAADAALSPRSVFRYFDDLDDLAMAAIEHQQQRLAPLWGLAIDPDAPVAERAEIFVDQRSRLLDAMGHVGRVARLRAPTRPLVAAEVARVRARLRSQVAETFAAELAALAPADAQARLDAADVACSFESNDLMCQQGFGADRSRRAMVVALDALFGTRR